MKRHILFLLMIIIPIVTFSQTLNLNCVAKKDIPVFRQSSTIQKSIAGWNTSIQKSDQLILQSFSKLQGSFVLLVNKGNDVGIPISIKYLEDLDFGAPQSINQVWALQAINSDIYVNLIEKGYQYDLRNELDEESNSFLSTFQERDILFHDDYLEDYLQSIFTEIHPITLSDKRPGNLNVIIIKLNEPNAICLPNGSIVITTGLLSLLDSEEELKAVLAHEVAHFVLDHWVVNINKEIERQERAAFWASFATSTAALTDIILATQKENYIPGILTLFVAIISANIASAATERLGLKYSQEQESEADMVAKAVLEYLGISALAISSVLSKLENYSISVGNYYALTNNGTHPGLPMRISKIGELGSVKFYNHDYHILISIVNTYNAEMEYHLKHFQKCNDFVQKNIDAGVAMEEDFVIKAKVTRALYNTPAKNQEALKYIQQAKSLNIIRMPEISKQEGLTLLRLKRYDEANIAFEDYLMNLEQYKDSEYLEFEKEWTRKMIFKTKIMQLQND